ncbi:MAG: TolC family protein [Deltaproteobacteria bacterium]|nr:TolC family protein [Deltaproteobacteria bacterium]
MSGNIKKLLLIPIFIAFTYGFTAAAVYAEDADTELFTLEKSVKQAIEKNWGVKTKEQAIEEAQYGKKKARADLLPRFSTTYSYRREGEVNEFEVGPGVTVPIGTENNYQWQGTITQPLFTGFALTSAYELAKLGIDLSNMELDIEKLDIALKAKDAYFNILKADKAVLVAQSAVESLQEHLNVAQNFYKVGMIPVNDLLKAEVELANSEQNLIKAQNGAKLARASFNIVLSRPINAPVEVVDKQDYAVEPIDFDRFYDQAIKKRPEISAVDINDQQVDQQIRIAKSKYYPEVSLTYNYTKSGDTPSVSGSSALLDSSGWQAMANLSWNLWSWGSDHYSIRQKELNKEQLINTKRSIEDGIKLEIKNAVLNLEETEKRIPAAKKAVEQGEENLRVSNERYKAQVTTSTEVLDAQTLLTQARSNYYSALYDHHLAKAALLRAIGEY